MKWPTEWSGWYHLLQENGDVVPCVKTRRSRIVECSLGERACRRYQDEVPRGVLPPARRREYLGGK